MAEKLTQQSDKRYKALGIKVYSSTEWLANSRKKYRQVFDRNEVAYLYIELTIVNKNFEIKDWDAKVSFHCSRFKNEGKEEVCNIDVEKTISASQNQVCIREGWGNEKKGDFWTRGDYVWEVFVDDVLVGKTFFYIEDVGMVSTYDNPYFELKSIKLYEGGIEGVEPHNRKYLSEFDANKTRFVWLEVIMENMQVDDWYCELFFNFYNSAGFLKGQTVELKKVFDRDDEWEIVSGWGAETVGTWHDDIYRVDIVFMDVLIASIPFECADEAVEGHNKVLTAEELLLIPERLDGGKVDAEPIEVTLEKLNSMVGLDQVKKQVHDYLDYLRFIKMRYDMGLEKSNKLNLHTVLKGNPGTGKTTVAKLLGKIFFKMGLLSKDKVLEVGRAELIGQYIGQTAPKVKEVIDRARGGVLFIDEAYSLVRNVNDDKDYGQEVLEVLVKEMSDGPGDIAIFFAGYPKGIDRVLEVNPGLKSRIRMTYDFLDYVPQQLMEIAELEAKKQGVQLSDDAKEFLNRKLTEAYRKRDEKFGNARLVERLMDKSKMNLGVRLMADGLDKSQASAELVSTIYEKDIRKVYDEVKPEVPELGIDEEALAKAQAELNQLVGLKNIKKDLDELIKLVRFYREIGHDILKNFSMHTVFKGNPGTGKTTVARILAEVYKALGILERGHLVECGKQTLVAGFVGQTAIKTKEVIDKARGGVLFIDEAYALYSPDDRNDFGKEAVEILLKEMEDNRGDILVVVAGYPKPMEKFLDMNPGLKSRFDKQLTFHDFEEKELMQVVDLMLQKEKLVLNKKAKAHLNKYVKYLYNTRDSYFGNARAIRQMVDKVVQHQHLRMAGLRSEQRSEKVLSTVVLEDVKIISPENDQLHAKKGVGFNVHAQ